MAKRQLNAAIKETIKCKHLGLKGKFSQVGAAAQRLHLVPWK